MNVECKGTTITGDIEIEAPPEAVFGALTDPSQLAAWWGSEDTYRTYDWQLDVRPGGSWSCQARDITGGTGAVHGTYLEVDPPHKLVYTWNPSWDPGPETRVEFRLERIASGTRLRLVHSGFEGRAQSQQGHSEGWQRVLGWLNAHLTSQVEK